ncbi:MAG TPA: hypothetical protein EYP11_04620 [Aquificaceae bacterium]|nr:hypothetical protein [Aquificaceae bacterium]
MGPLKYLFITDRKNILGANERFIYTYEGRKIPIVDIKGIVSFHYLKILRDLAVPTAVVKKEGIEFLNLRVDYTPKEFNRLNLELFAYDVSDLSVRIARNVVNYLNIYDIEIPNIKILHSLCLIERLLFHTFCAFLTIYTKTMFKFLIDPTKKLSFCGMNLRLWELLFLPAVSYALLREIDKIISYDIKPYKQPKECVNLLLSYIMGNLKFSFLVEKSVGLALRYNLAEPHLSQSHSCFPSHTGKLRKPRKRVEPP